MVVLFVLAVLATGCQREEVQVYVVDKESRPKSPTADPHAGHGHGPLPSRPQIDYRMPEGWTSQPPTTMRVASFTVPGPENQSADVAVIPLPGMTGRDLDMVNLWRGQVRLEPIDASEMERSVTKVPVGSVEGKFFDMAGTTPVEGEQSPLRVMVAMIERDGLSWFFKMTGPDALVQSQKAAFLDFLKSVEFRVAGQEPAPHGERAAAPVPAGEADDGKPAWTVPAGWQEVPGGQFLVAKFNVTGEGSASASVNVSMSAGDGGGWIGNVNRWRGQVGLPPQSAAEINAATRAVDVTGGRAMFVEMLGTDARTEQPARVLGAMVPQSERAWFYKLMGEPKLVDSQREAFTQFVQSAKY